MKRVHRLLPLYPALVIGDIFSVEQLIGWGVFAQAVLWSWAGIHKGLSDYRQAGVRDAALMDVKHELGVFDHVHPETQRKAGRRRQKEDVRGKISPEFNEIMQIEFKICDIRSVVPSFKVLLLRSHQLLFHVWRTSVSWMPCLSACSSRKSNMYLMARGRVLPRCTVLNNVSKRSSTNFCSVPWVMKSTERLAAN